MFSLPTTSFVLIARSDRVDYLTGKIIQVETLAEVESLMVDHSEMVFLNPFCSIRERGYEAFGSEPILVLIPDQKQVFDRTDFINLLPDQNCAQVGGVKPSISDADFEALVSKIQTQEIRGGNASQVILSRVFKTQIADFDASKLLSLYRDLLGRSGAYHTFLLGDFSGEQPHFFAGATPERHLQITDQKTLMNPIAGTMPKGELVNFETRLGAFLQDPKEINELFQVLDEEVKMMAKICPKGGVIQGPFLRETGAVVHTDYRLEGVRTHLSPFEALKQTLHAPTLVGGPLESAARIIRQYENHSRRYYGGELCMVEGRNFDSSILIRSAEIDHQGRISVQAGAGIVRDSVPALEARETRLKAEGFLACLSNQKSTSALFLPTLDLDLDSLLAYRNKALSTFLFEDQSDFECTKDLLGRKVLIVNNEDDFAEVLGHMMRHMGMEVEVCDTFEVTDLDAGIVVFGPGPGDINDPDHPRMKRLRDLVDQRFLSGGKMLGICLGHQALAHHRGLSVVQKKSCTQGVQVVVEVFGNRESCGFYNSFVPYENGEEVDVAEGDNFISFQFHPESVMTHNGYNILVTSLKKLI